MEMVSLFCVLDELPPRSEDVLVDEDPESPESVVESVVEARFDDVVPDICDCVDESSSVVDTDESVELLIPPAEPSELEDVCKFELMSVLVWLVMLEDIAESVVVSTTVCVLSVLNELSPELVGSTVSVLDEPSVFVAELESNAELEDVIPPLSPSVMLDEVSIEPLSPVEVL